ncbi:MAG: response regulator [Coriobacteriales bacterium]|nr:response regulator [Coriobacteriales bacterium]
MKTAKILVVDDEPSILRLVQAALEPRGYEVITADNGVDAIHIAGRDQPDLVLLDIMMPHMDGNEVRRRLHNDPKTKDIPVAHLSAVGDFNQQLEGLQSGAIDYIVKPFAPKDLQQRVADLLDPHKRAEIQREHDRKQGKMRTIVGIMQKKTGDG